MRRSKRVLAFAMALACVTAVPVSTAMMMTTTVCAADAVSEDVLNEIGEAAIAAAKKVKFFIIIKIVSISIITIYISI